MKNNIRWMNYYRLLEEYYKEYGNIDVPQTYNIDGVKLGRWLFCQRESYNGIGQRKITKEQIKLLNKLGMKWEIKKRKGWDYYYSLLEKYYEEHGNIDVSQDYEIDGVKLGFWLSNQRIAYRGKGNYKISEKRIELLEKLGMKWNIKKETWDYNYSLLVKYYEEHGNIDVPTLYEIDGVKLGRWLVTQKTAYKGVGDHKISEKQIELLEKLGIKWSRTNKTWDYNYSLLEKYYEEYGNIDIPQTYEIDGVKLGFWLKNQRLAYHGKNNSKISEKQIELLEKLGMKWNIKERTWDYYHSLLVKYYQEHGNIDISSFYVIDGVKLGSWLSRQKNLYKNGELSQEYVQLLNNLNVDWNINDTKILNKNITTVNKQDYNTIILKRLKNILEDLINEGFNEINDYESQKETEVVIVKRLWR